MRKEKTTWKKAFMILMMLIITLSIVIAANDPGHDTLYVEQTGDSEITGNLNISGNLSVEDVIFSGVDLDVRGDGVQAAGSNNQIIGTSNALSIQSLGHIYINTLTGTTSMIYLGDGADTVNLNITGALYIQSGTATIGGSAICLANGTNCPSALGGANVTGPASSTDNAIARWNGAGGNVLQNSAVTIDDSNNLRTAGDINTSGGDICIEGGQCLSQMGSGTGTVTSVTAGDGMTQTGTATINPTLNVVSHAGTAGSIGTINIGADAIGTNLGTSSTTAYRGDYGNTAYTDRLKWDGGSTGLTASTGRTSLGATTIGSNLFNLTNPSAITFLRINADNTADTLNAADFRTAIGAGTGGGSVTSVAMTVPTGLTISGSPITTSGTLALSLTSGYTIPTTTNITNLGTAYTHSQIAGGDSVHVSTTENTNWDTAYTHSQIAGGDSVHVSTTENTNWDTAYTDRLKWDGGSTGLTASTGRTSLGATTIGSNLFNLTNPSAITFLRINADNTASTLNAADFRTAIGAGTGDGSGSVTSVAMTVPTGLSISGTPITTSGTLALSLTAGYTIPTTTNITNLGTAYTHSQATTNVHGLTFTAEGSGGGLDADTLDGMDSSAFGDATAANQNTIIGYIDTEIAAILDDTGTSGVVIANDAITAAKIAADAIGASEAGFLTDSIGFAGADIATIKGYIDTEIGANTDSASMSSSLFAGQQAIYDNISKSRSESFTSSGTWNQPNGVTLVWVTMIGGGGGGGGGDGWGNQDGGGGGGAGMKYYRYPVEVSGDVTVTVGAAGSGGAGGNGGASMNGTSGGNTSFGSLVAEGGKFGGGVWTAAAGLGGNGGGYGGQNLGGAGGTGNGADPIHLTSYAIGGAGGGGGSEAGDSGQHGGSNLFHTKGLAAGAPTGGLGGGGGGGASAMGNGGNGGAATGGNGAAGTGYGAGGGGGAYYPGGQAGNGGAGSGGYILVEWIGPAN